MAARAIISLDDLRRWARVAREEGVSIRGRAEPEGGWTVFVDPAAPRQRDDEDSDLDDRLRSFARK